MIKLKKYEGKHFFTFASNLFNYKTLKDMGVFEWRFIKSIFKKQKGKYGNIIILSDGMIVGGVGFAERSKGVFEIGIVIFKKYRYKSIATKSVRKLASRLKKMGAKKIIAISNKNNLRSISLFKKLGYIKARENKKEIFWEKKIK